MAKRKPKQIPCLNCGKIGVYWRGMCYTCISKKRRETEQGKSEVRRYNESDKAKASREKYLAKKRKPKEIKICKCGKVAIAKGYCRNCYQKIRDKKLRIDKGIIPRKSPERLKKLNISRKEVFISVLSLVKQGLTISKALSVIKINSNWFYKSINENQKIELKVYKSIGKLADEDDE